MNTIAKSLLGFLQLEYVSRDIHSSRCNAEGLLKYKMSLLFDEAAWQSKIDDARGMDRQILNNKLDSLEANSSQLEEALSIFCYCIIDILLISASSGFSELQDNDMVPIMVCLQRQLESRSIGGRERQFFSHVVQYLSSFTGSQVNVENWMITPYEVDFGQRIGVGGLYEFMH